MPATESKYNIDPQGLYRTADAAKKLQESTPTLARKRGRGEGPKYIKKGPTVIYPGYSLIDYLDSCLVETSPHTNTAA